MTGFGGFDFSAIGNYAVVLFISTKWVNNRLVECEPYWVQGAVPHDWNGETIRYIHRNGKWIKFNEADYGLRH